MILGIRQVEIHWKRGSCWNREGTVSEIRTARTVAEHGVQIQASLRIPEVEIVGCQQPMSLRSYIAHLQFQVPAQLTLDRQVVLRRILTPHFRLKLTEQKNGAEHPPVHRLPPFRIQDAVDTGQRGQAEWIGIREAPALVEKRSVEQGVEGEGATAEWRLGAELFQHQLLNRVIEQSPSRLNAGLT